MSTTSFQSIFALHLLLLIIIMAMMQREIGGSVIYNLVRKRERERERERELGRRRVGLCVPASCMCTI